MLCPNCSHENRADARFCLACGVPLQLQCENCGSQLPPEASFCDACGHPVSDDRSSTIEVEAPANGGATLADRSFAEGRYSLRELIGVGGTKTVYVALDTVLDREVALALIKTEGLDEVGRERILREARTMARLGDHPNIVQIHDLGDEDGNPYLILPLMTGGSVEDLVRNSPDRRLPLDQGIAIAKDVCRGLEFAHSSGIVHRDLKPGNIWLAADGVAGIGDFGLAIGTDFSRITRAEVIMGTPHYMAPEQATGNDVTEQSDLYALGCMLYQIVTGTPPFLGDDPVAIISQHVNTPPVAPTWQNSLCPRPLEALILRLLAKDPAERPASATDVLTALDGIDLAADAGKLPDEGARSLDSLAAGVFVGRKREMGELKAALEEALSGHGRTILVTGESGIGKTRTAEELATYAGLRASLVLWGRCYEGSGMPPYWPWIQSIRSYVQLRDADSIRSEMGSGASDIAAIVSEVRELLPDIEPAPSLQDPEQARFRLFDSITGFLKNAARSRPLVLIVDNLHLADMPSLLLLEFVAREIADAPILLVGTYQDVDLSRRHPLSQTLGRLSEEQLSDRLPLRGLTHQDVARFIELVAGISPPQALVRAVHTQTEGNPLFITEVVRLLVQEGELTDEQLTERKTWSVKIPEGVREVIGKRLDRLSEQCNQLLTVASVVGREFDFLLLRRLMDDLPEDGLLEVLDEAIAARNIEELPGTAGRYQFSHRLFQQTLVEELSVARRVRLHARIAEGIEQLYGARAEDHASELARHFAEAEPLIGAEKLVHYSLIAGRQALEAYGYEDAIDLFDRALEAKRTQSMDGGIAALLHGRGRAQAALDRPDEAVSSLTRAFDYFAEVGDVPQAVAVAESPIIALPGVTGLADLIAHALTLVPAESPEAGRLLSRYIIPLAVEKGDHERAQKAAAQALTIAQRELDSALELRTLADSADVAGRYLNFSEALSKSLQAVELAQKVDEPHAASVASFWAATTSRIVGDFEGAARHAAEGLALAERLRDRFRVSGFLLAGGELARLQGAWETAREFSERGLAAAPGDPMSPALRALVEHQVGDFQRGATYLERVLEFVSEAPPEPTLLYMYSALTIPGVAIITGDTDHLDTAHAAIQSLLTSRHATELVSMTGRTGLAMIAAQRGDIAAAEEQYASLASVRGAFLSHMSNDRLLGVLTRTMGRLDRSISHFEDAVEFCRQAGCRSELAWTYSDYADTLLKRNEVGWKKWTPKSE